jgi:Fibronectin type III domain
MPTISQLPPTSSVSASDAIPVSQGGTARAASVGVLLASTQPAIIVDSASLIGRSSLGQGGPEQVEVGVGMTLSNGSLHADGSDHANYPSIATLAIDSDLVISNQGSPMRMQTSLLRGLFSAGKNVTIAADGVISTSVINSVGSGPSLGSAIGALQLLSGLSAQDLVAVSHAGSDSAIPYADFLGGVTIDQAQRAGPVADSDTFWAAQGSNVMASQNFSSIWLWIANRLPTYKAPVVEITASINLDATVHHGRTLVCSQPVILTPLTANMGSGFQCSVINASSGNVTLGSGFVSSTGGLTLTPWQSASLSSVTYSGGTIAFATMPGGGLTQVPGQVTGLSSSGITEATITISWLAPLSGGPVSSYILQYRPTGGSSWSSTSPIVAATTYQITDLPAGTNHDVVVTATNASGSGATSAILTTATASVVLPAAPSQVLGLVAIPTSGTAVGLTWTAQSGANAASSYTVQYRKSGSSAWTSIFANVLNASSTVPGLLAATSYDFTVFGVNTAGVGPTSLTVTATTLAASQSVSSIAWNSVPSGAYTHANGSIGVNAHVTPASSPVQFGFSLSAASPPSSWTAAILVNTDLWGAYVPTPAAPGNWYSWAEGLDGSAPTVSASPFLVQ